MCIIDCLSTIVFILPLHLDYTKVIILILWWRNFQLEYWRTFQLVSTQEDGDWLFFGYCHIQEWEWGYVLLSQIQEVNVRGLTVQLDKGLKTGITVKACLN